MHTYIRIHTKILYMAIILNLFVCLFFGSYFQIIGLKGLNFSKFEGVHPGDIIMKFSKDQYFH